MTKVSTHHDHNRPLNRQDYKTLSLAALGGALEFYDFIIFVFFAVVIGELFFPADIPEWLRQFQTFGIFAAGYLARPLGGIIMAHFGDLIGRKRMFTLSIILMALPTLLIGLLPTYATLGIAAPLLLLLLRILQGAAIGGEVPGAWVFVAEHVPARPCSCGWARSIRPAPRTIAQRPCRRHGCGSGHRPGGVRPGGHPRHRPGGVRPGGVRPQHRPQR